MKDAWASKHHVETADFGCLPGHALAGQNQDWVPRFRPMLPEVGIFDRTKGEAKPHSFKTDSYRINDATFAVFAIPSAQFTISMN